MEQRRGKFTTEEVIARFKVVHGDRYDYSKVEYRHSKEKVNVICKKHGDFQITPNKHLGGTGCKKCWVDRMAKERTMSTDEFIKRSKKAHLETYDYTDTEYKTMYKKVKIKCRKHGIFHQRAGDHVKGHGCPKCGNEQNAQNKYYTTKEFVKRANKEHKNKYKYERTAYINSETAVIITCPVHGDFTQLPVYHLSGKGCKQCGFEKVGEHKRYSREEFIRKAQRRHRTKYNYDKTIYKNSQTKVTIVCPEHGEFEQVPYSHLSGTGCPRCTHVVSHQENQVGEFISGFVNIETSVRNLIDGEIDIYIPELKIAIEYNGVFWHSTKYKDKNYHLEKTKQCEEKGLRLIHIFEDEWVHKEEIVKNKLKGILNRGDYKAESVKKELREISKRTARDFVEKNNIKPFLAAKKYYGYYEEGTLTGTMSIATVKNKNEVYEGIVVTQLTVKKGENECNRTTSIMNILGEIFPKTDVQIYMDRGWESQLDLESRGFEVIGKTKPTYRYVKGNTLVTKEAIETDGDNEELRVYDCGQYICRKQANSK